MKISEFQENNLRKAVEIYNKIIHQKETSDNEIESLIYSVKEQIQDHGWAYVKKGFPNWNHARMQVGHSNNEKYYYWIDTNDDNPDMEEIRKENLKYKIKIESEWKKVNIPTK